MEDQPRPQIASLDWLSFSISLSKTYEERVIGHAKMANPQGYTLVECSHGTPQYKRRHYLLTSGGDKVLTILTEPHSKIINQDDAYIEVANPILYGDTSLDYLLDLLQQIHQYSFRSLSRLDVACDFEPTPAQMTTIRDLQANRVYCTGKREGVQFHDYTRTIAGVVQTARQISWGSKYSDMRWKLYNKSLEIYQPDDKGRSWCTKPWIVRRWEANGLPTHGVWRLECSLMGASTYSWRGDKMGWPIISSGDWSAWFWDTVATRFILRKNEGHQCRKNDTIVPLLDIPDTPHYRTRELVGEDRQASPDHAATLRACIKQLERPEVAYSQPMRELWLETTAQVIDRAHLHGYFQRVMGTTFEEYAATVGDPLLTTL